MQSNIEISKHSEYALKFLDEVSPIEKRIAQGPLFSEMAAGNLSMKRFRAALVNFYPLVENVPLYMAGSIRKIPTGDAPRNDMARIWLMGNINTEQRHAIWYRQWAADFGVKKNTFQRRITPPAEMDAVNHYLWNISQRGDLAECLGAINYAIESPTAIWSQGLAKNLDAYQDNSGVKFSRGTAYWVRAHAKYDDKHAPEALEIIKNFSESDEDWERVTTATKRAMEYYAMAADSCYSIFE